MHSLSLLLTPPPSLPISLSLPPPLPLFQLEKHIWICAFMAVGAKHACTVGEVVEQHTEEVRTLIAELMDAAATVIPASYTCILSYHIPPCPY
jgi:ketopantoate reductase